MNEADDKGNNDGWEDNDDWGSLEDSKPKAETNATSSFDWGGGFNQGSKSHDPFADIKTSSTTSTSDNLMAGPGGWDDWGSGGQTEDGGKEEVLEVGMIGVQEARLRTE